MDYTIDKIKFDKIPTPEDTTPLSSENFFNFVSKAKNIFLNLKSKPNIITVSQAGVGAGHMREVFQAKRFFVEYLGLEKYVSTIEYDFFEQKKIMTAIVSRGYSLLQKNPSANTAFKDKVIKSKLTNKIRDFVQIAFASEQIDIIKRTLQKQKNYDPDKPSLFITGHFAATYALEILIKERSFDGGIIFFNPDPLRDYELATMTLPILTRSVLSVMHDKQTAAIYKQIRNYPALGLGTLSNPIFLADKNVSEQKFVNNKVHIIIEFSGNRIDKYDDLISEFLRSERQRIDSGEIFVSICTMHHKKTFEKLKTIISESKIKGNIFMLRAKNVIAAVNLREELVVTGKIKNIDGNEIYGEQIIEKRPIIHIAKGESVIEDRGARLVFCPFASGHEEYYLAQGVKQRGSYDITKLVPSKWYQKIVEEVEKIKSKKNNHRQSWAVFAPMLFFDPKFFDNFRREGG